MATKTDKTAEKKTTVSTAKKTAAKTTTAKASSAKAASEKKPASTAKTGSTSTAKKASSTAKTGSTSTAKTANAEEFKLTAAEKKLVEAYRAADADAKKAALALLNGEKVEDSSVLTSVLSCQVISNVPSAILLSQFTENYASLLTGVNIGGAGTQISYFLRKGAVFRLKFFYVINNIFALETAEH